MDENLLGSAVPITAGLVLPAGALLIRDGYLYRASAALVLAGLLL